MFKRLGKAPAGKRQEKIETQENYRNGKFHNLEPTAVSPEDVSFFKVLKEFLTRPNSVTPSGALPHKKANLFRLPAGDISVVWFGHSSYLINYRGYVILVDPVFCGNASPVNFFGKPFSGTDFYTVEDFPGIDLLLITHDHYDHLDYPFIKKIKNKVEKVITSLGVGAHLELWGMPHEKITELGWQEGIKVNDHLHITALPSRHFSGRSAKRFNTLWSSFALVWEDIRIYVGGDSGYSPQFKEIGEQFGGFDLAFLECGQYSKYWPQIHMQPEETVKAAKDLNAKVLFPVHWGKFVLSIHPWDEPIVHLTAEAEKRDQKFVAPLIGEVYKPGEAYDQKKWWNFENKLKDMKDLKEHWEKIYTTKEQKEVSWYQEKPQPSLSLIESLNLSKDAAIIDIGGGDSFLVDFLLKIGYTNITVLDISEEAINRAKSRLGKKAEKVTWVIADAGDLKLNNSYDLWHDRAAFHFLTEDTRIQNYLQSMKNSVKKGGYLILGTFSEKGPEKCSGIKIKQYSLHDMTNLFEEDFETIQCENIDHITPSGSIQNFSFCTFKRL